MDVADQGPRRISRREIQDAFADGWVIETIKPSEYEVRTEPGDVSFSDGGPKAWFVVARRLGTQEQDRRPGEWVASI